ncbi:MAG: HNH endonuclease [Candidatus Omnitrophica bacterium]|nr:HNH endonuclease [Candidatus Omnitrophota bacterium]
MDLKTTITKIEDELLPHFQCDIYERGIYYYLFRQTYLNDKESAIVPLSIISKTLCCSEWQARKSLRQLAQKGCIQLEQTRKGHLIKILLPEQLLLSSDKNNEEDIGDIEKIDFYKNPDYRKTILIRENYRCFYCFKKLSEENYELDHVIPQKNSTDNSYRNIVASCLRCNALKQGNSAENHIRLLYRDDLLDEDEFNNRIKALEALKNGLIKPKI